MASGSGAYCSAGITLSLGLWCSDYQVCLSPQRSGVRIPVDAMNFHVSNYINATPLAKVSGNHVPR